MLCRSLPSPSLVATLLQLSKRTRRMVWQFLSDPDRCTTEWCNAFSTQLWHYRDSRNTQTVTYYSMHPTFFSPVGKYATAESYKLGKILVDTPRACVEETDVLVAGYYHCEPDAKCSWPGWLLVKNAVTADFFEWYVVASALSLRMDRMVVYVGHIRWDGMDIVPNDAALYMAH